MVEPVRIFNNVRSAKWQGPTPGSMHPEKCNMSASDPRFPQVPRFPRPGSCRFLSASDPRFTDPRFTRFICGSKGLPRWSGSRS